ncbi:MAG: 5-(carboxyamino)imidazole ribonucleotide synthase [Chloroflexi bacterium]|nr:5-(carboxyamino)imidazole ribonucleotide synthase [Chloroflexota bacterium]
MSEPRTANAARPIGTYERKSAGVLEWDPRVFDVAARVIALVRERRPDINVEHIGSTAVEGLPGKGIVDLATEVDADDVPGVTEVLLELGFQRQPGPDPFPAVRPMLVGTLDVGGTAFRIHFHVQPRHHPVWSGGYARELRFRDALRTDTELASDYARLKRGIVETGVDGRVDALAYTHAKTVWIRDVYRRLGIGFEPILPPATIAILGGGQLGRMLGLAARALGYRIAVLDPDPDCPAAAIADRVEIGAYDDLAAAKRLAAGSAIATYELEHISANLADQLDEEIQLRPGNYPLRVAQDRLAERQFLTRYELGVAPWREVRSEADLRDAAEELGLPLRLKVAIGGYDGRSQLRIREESELGAALGRLGRPDGEAVLVERELTFEAELSVICARAADGETAAYPVARNVHDGGILVESSAPADVPERVAAAATDVAKRIATYLGLVGVVTVELFLLADGELAVNEIAPRVHNSGHWTIEAAATSQFEQHIRAICGLPLGSTALLAPAAATVNLLGAGAERPAQPRGIEAALAVDGAHVHLYDKRLVRERRKMGHVSALGPTPGEALAIAREAHARLGWA